MATTLTYNDYLKMLRPNVPANVLDFSGPQVANLAIRKVWSRYPWRAFVLDFRPFFLIPLEQDYGPPFNIVPADFDSFVNANLVTLPSGGNALRYQPMQVKKFLETTSKRGVPDCISFHVGRPGRAEDTGQSGQFRLHPRPSESMTCPKWFVEGRYKRTPSRITNTDIDSPIPFDDKYETQMYDVFLWAGKKLAGHDVGATVTQNGVAQHSGATAAMMAAIDEMAAIEGFAAGDNTVAPEAPLDSNWQPIGGNFGNLFV